MPGTQRHVPPPELGPSRSGARRLALVACAVVLAATVPGWTGTAFSQPAFAATAGTPVYLDTHYTFEERAADLVSRMTPAEKAAQLNSGDGSGRAPAIPRLGVQGYTYWSEGAHGINYLGNSTNDGGQGGNPATTSFPVNFASTMTWDPSLEYQETTAISDEARGFLDKSLWGVSSNNLGDSASNYGSLTFWAPTVNMDRDPRWGRTDEAFGEDPYLVGKMAGAFVNGYQGNDQSGNSLNGYLKVAATAKHFALNNTEYDRKSSDSVVTDSDLHDYYSAQFKSLIEDAHVAGLMSSYNAINGTPAVEDTYTLSQIAQRTYGFGGYTTSDCGGVTTAYDGPPDPEGGGHSWAPPGWSTDAAGMNATWTNTTTGAQISGAAGAQAYSLRAGTQGNCYGGENSAANLQAAINAGVLSEGVIDNALVRMFTVRMETGEFDPPSRNSYTSITKSVIESPVHQALAQTVADNSLVLLKNDNVPGTSAPLLPANPDSLNNVVILGDMANTVTLGSYSDTAGNEVSAVQGITAAVKAANPNATITFDAAGTSSTASSSTPAVLSAATQTAIKNADLVIEFVGTNLDNAQENVDRPDLNMPGNYDSLISQVAALGNPKTALVVQSNGPVKVSDVQGSFPAMVFSGYNGEAQGAALADVLFGKQNPSGHLDFTWYQDASQLPAMSNYGLTPSETGGLGRTYQYFTGTPSYPFGYGLSYSSFSYGAATIDKGSATADDTVNVSFSVTNTGATAGATVAQLYAASPSVPGTQVPTKRLVGFQKTGVLAPGASQSITIPVKISDLAMWDAANAKQVVADGTYTFQVAASATDVRSTVTTSVSGAITPAVQYVTVQPENVVYAPGQTIDLTGKNQWLKDDTTGVGADAQAGRNMNVTADNVVEAVNNDESFVNLPTATVSYSSSNLAVATVSSTGQVTAVAAGAATITVTVNGVSGSAPIVVQQPAPAAPVTAGSVYEIQRSGTNQVIDDPAASTTAGTQQEVWTLNAGSNQQWTAVGNPDGTFSFKNGASGQCLDVQYGSTSAGAPVIQWTCSGAANQEWTVTPSGSGYTIVSKNSGLAIAAGGTGDGSTLTQQATGTVWNLTQVS